MHALSQITFGNKGSSRKRSGTCAAGRVPKMAADWQVTGASAAAASAARLPQLLSASFAPPSASPAPPSDSSLSPPSGR